MKTFVAIVTERDDAIREKNMALEERKMAFAERDIAILQRDAAISERDAAIRERDDVIASARFPENYTNYIIPDSLASGQHGELIQYQQQMPAKSPKVAVRTVDGWVNKQNFESDEEGLEKQVSWKDNLGLNRINFDESAMPVPVCTCTGAPQPCYRWGNAGWQSACCTTTISMYPLPQVANKRYSRVGGRKMSGSAFRKLLNRLADEGYDFSSPLDLKNHWAKHGTNRYSTLK